MTPDADIPEAVLAVMGRLRAQLLGQPGIVSVGLVYNGDQWEVAVWRHRRPYDTAQVPTVVDGVRVWTVFMTELPDTDD